MRVICCLFLLLPACASRVPCDGPLQPINLPVRRALAGTAVSAPGTASTAPGAAAVTAEFAGTASGIAGSPPGDAGAAAGLKLHPRSSP